MPVSHPALAPLPPATGRTAMILVAVVASGGALYALRSILTPVALALFLMVIIDGFSRVLRRRIPRLSETWALYLAIALTVLAFGGAAALVAADTSQFVGQLVTDIPRLNAVIAEVGPHLGLHAAPTIDELIHQFDPARYVGVIAQTLQGFASGAALVMIYLGFLFASRQGVTRKTERLFVDPDERENARMAFTHIRNGIERYLWIQTLAGLLIAAGSGAVIAAAGMENPLFWAFLILVLSYVPIIGGLVGMLLPPLFALVEFDAHWHALAVLGGLSLINFGVGNVLFPRMAGRSLNLDPVVILLALSFWGLVWGVPGMFLSTPLTVTLMVVSEQFKGARWIAILLSSDGDPEDSLAHSGVRASVASVAHSRRPSKRAHESVKPAP